MVIADLSLAPILAPVLPRMETVHTVIAVGAGDLAPFERSGKKVVRYHDITAAESDEFDWPDVDENSAAAMCYTSGTTGHPKGVCRATGRAICIKNVSKCFDVVDYVEANYYANTINNSIDINRKQGENHEV